MKNLKLNLSLRSKTGLLSIIAMLFFTPALADHSHQNGSTHVSQGAAIKNAKGEVIGAITQVVLETRHHRVNTTCLVPETRKVPETRRVCSGKDRATIAGFTTNELFGAVLGGAAGQSIGKGSGRAAATAAGALLGGKLGQGIDEGKEGRHCATRTVYVEKSYNRRVECVKDEPVKGHFIHFTVGGKRQQVWLPIGGHHRQTYR